MFYTFKITLQNGKVFNVTAMTETSARLQIQGIAFDYSPVVSVEIVS